MRYGTTDRCIGGTPTVSDYYLDDSVTYTASKIVDNNESTMWQSKNSAYPHWFKYDFGLGILWKISKLRVLAWEAGDGLRFKDFTVQGSNNDSTWSTLYTGIAANSSAWQEFTFINNIAYRYIKVNVTSGYSTGSPNITTFFEVEMFEGIPTAGNFSGGGLLDFLALQKEGRVR